MIVGCILVFVFRWSAVCLAPPSRPLMNRSTYMWRDTNITYEMCLCYIYETMDVNKRNRESSESLVSWTGDVYSYILWQLSKIMRWKRLVAVTDHCNALNDLLSHCMCPLISKFRTNNGLNINCKTFSWQWRKTLLLTVFIKIFEIEGVRRIIVLLVLVEDSVYCANCMLFFRESIMSMIDWMLMILCQ